VGFEFDRRGSESRFAAYVETLTTALGHADRGAPHPAGGRQAKASSPCQVFCRRSPEPSIAHRRVESADFASSSAKGSVNAKST
jgi:hypothetical protein